jgi:hypothetical protein
VVGYPKNAWVKITWQRLSGSTIDIGTYFTNEVGSVKGQFRVPATEGGKGQKIIFTSGSVTKVADFEVVPRVKVTTNPAVRGLLADVSLRGYAKNETVRIRWLKGSSWITLATVVTSNTGSANVPVLVPLWAPDGMNSVRGDGTIFRQQTNTVYVQGGLYIPASVSLSTSLAAVKDEAW